MWNTYPHTRANTCTQTHTYIRKFTLTTLKPLTGEVNRNVYLLTRQYCAGKPWLLWMLWDMHQHITDLTYPPMRPTAQQTVVKDGSKSTIKRLISMHKDSRGTLHWPFMVKCGHLKSRSRYAYFQVDCHKWTLCASVNEKIDFFCSNNC